MERNMGCLGWALKKLGSCGEDGLEPPSEGHCGDYKVLSSTPSREERATETRTERVRQRRETNKCQVSLPARSNASVLG